MGLEELQRWWEIPAIAHFCCLFSEAFNLNDFDIEELEAALLAEVGVTSDIDIEVVWMMMMMMMTTKLMMMIMKTKLMIMTAKLLMIMTTKLMMMIMTAKLMMIMTTKLMMMTLNESFSDNMNEICC